MVISVPDATAEVLCITGSRQRLGDPQHFLYFVPDPHQQG
jgi:hypothetical protein